MTDKYEVKDQWGRTLGRVERELSPFEQGQRAGEVIGGVAAVVGWMLRGNRSAAASPAAVPQPRTAFAAPFDPNHVWQVNERALVKWSHDEYWYPATVGAVEGDRVYVLFDDGDKEWTSPRSMMPIDLEVGDRVQCRWKGGQYYYLGHITKREGERIHVHYDDNDKEWTTISTVRVTR